MSPSIVHGGQRPAGAARLARATKDETVRTRRPDLWVFGPGGDLLLIIASPLLLVVPVFALARSRMGLEQLAVYVAAFGALGHHLPGMLRAYGDRALFRRFRTRFVLAPILIAAATLTCAFLDLGALNLVILIWGFWHAAMQTYGFARIYDAKARIFNLWTQRLDLALCLSWFGTAILVSPTHSFRIIRLLHLQCGWPMPDPGVLRGIQMAAVGLTVGTTALFLHRLGSAWRAGLRPSFQKLGLLASAIGFWCCAVLLVDSAIVGVALFEMFHDVQYLAIVWAFNRGRIERGVGAGALTRMIFRRSGIFVGLYVGLVAAYGALRLADRGVDSAVFRDVLLGLTAASTLLHFYYDGFIWKVREDQTSASLGIAGSADRARGPARYAHALKWAPLVVALLALSVSEMRNERGNFGRLRELATIMPDHPEVQRAMGDAMRGFGRPERALEHYARAVELGHTSGDTLARLGTLLVSKGRADEAMPYIDAALDLAPGLAEAHVGLGNALIARREAEPARAAFQQAIELAPERADAHHGLAQALSALGAPELAIEQYRAAIRIAPSSWSSHLNLGVLLRELGRTGEARESFEEVIRLQPDNPLGHFHLGELHEAEGQVRSSSIHDRQEPESAPRARAHHPQGV